MYELPVQRPVSRPRRQWLLAIAGAALTHAAALQAQPRDGSLDALLAALEIKAEAQRYAKLSAEVHLGLLGAKAARQRLAAAGEIDSFLAKLSALSAGVGLHAEVKSLVDIGRKLVETPSISPDTGRLGDIARLSDQVTAQAERIAGLVQQRSEPSAGKAITLAARAMYLSQRTARDYMLVHARLDPGQTLAKGILHEKAELDAALDQLTAFPLSNTSIQQGLQLARLQWVLARDALAANKLDNYSAEQVARTSERMFEVLEDVMEQYVRLMAAIL